MYTYKRAPSRLQLATAVHEPYAYIRHTYIHTYMYACIHTNGHFPGFSSRPPYMSRIHIYNIHTYMYACIHTHGHFPGFRSRPPYVCRMHTYDIHTYIHVRMYTYTQAFEASARDRRTCNTPYTYMHTTCVHVHIYKYRRFWGYSSRPPHM